MNQLRRLFATIPVSTLLTSGFAAAQALGRPSPRLPSEGALPSLSGATEWINTVPLSPEALRGKVVLVNFWTYTCINSLRPMPYIRAWAEKYSEAGLVVIGAHSPEFSFERLSANVHRAVKDISVPFPIAVDSNFELWRAFGNRYWPAFYFVDRQGRIRHHRFGEDEYAKSEQIIQQLLAEDGRTDVPTGLVSPIGNGTQSGPGSPPAQSGETYLGYEQASNFAANAGLVRDSAHDYTNGAPLQSNQWTLVGSWTVERERAVLAKAGGRIAFRFHARDLHLVMGPSQDGMPVRFKVFIDGRPPMQERGADIDAQGSGAIEAPKLYQLVRQITNEKDRIFEIEFLDAGAQVYVFTFG